MGNTTSRVDFNGRTTTYLYDTLNWLTRKTPDASFFSAPVQYGYLANGLRASMSDVSGATSYSYDARNRLVTKTTTQGALSYGYDARGNVTSMQSSNTNGTWVNYSHDALNRLATVVDRRLPSGTTMLRNPETFQTGNRLYFYFTRYLLERASWICAASREAKEKKYGDGSARVLFSNMNEVSRLQISEYFAKLRSLDTSIDWAAVHPESFETLSPGRHVGLQFADIVAGSFYCADHHCSKSKTTEWVELLKPVVYRGSEGRYLGYGIKAFPGEAGDRNAQGISRMPWAHVLYR